VETRRNFFGKLAAVAAAVVSFPSSLSSAKEEKPNNVDLLLAKQEAGHYDAICDALPGDMLLCKETGEIIRVNGDGTCVRGLYGTHASDTDIHLKINSKGWIYVGRF